MDRRAFLRAGVAAAGGASVLPTIRMATAGAQSDTAGPSPYGPLAEEPDSNGLLLPEGFTSRVIAVGGEAVSDTGHGWHPYPDGAATFDDGAGGWYYACNSEVFVEGLGGASAIHFDRDGSILDAYPILDGTTANCAGGPTPWGTWLSCEEIFAGTGQVYECDPTGAEPGVVRPAMGSFAHEAVAVDPERERLYLTQDWPTGLLYRFTPERYPDLAAGFLEAAVIDGDGAVTWVAIPDPTGATTLTHEQVQATIFNGGEGIWYHDDTVYFTTKGDNSVHAIDTSAQAYSLIYRPFQPVDPVQTVLSGVDNITVDGGSGDLLVAEDGGNMELVVITPDGLIEPFLRVTGQEDSEVTGPAFTPNRDRLYFSSQRGPSPKNLADLYPEQVPDDDNLPSLGVTYEISGPFRGAIDATTAPSTTSSSISTGSAAASSTTIADPMETLATATGATAGSGDDDDTNAGAVALGVGGAALAAAGAAVFLRNRRRSGSDDAEAGE